MARTRPASPAQRVRRASAGRAGAASVACRSSASAPIRPSTSNTSRPATAVPWSASARPRPIFATVVARARCASTPVVPCLRRRSARRTMRGSEQPPTAVSTVAASGSSVSPACDRVCRAPPMLGAARAGAPQVDHGSESQMLVSLERTGGLGRSMTLRAKLGSVLVIVACVSCRGSKGPGPADARSDGAFNRSASCTGVAAIGGPGDVWATKLGGSVWRWGVNATGQLGDGTLTHVSSPSNRRRFTMPEVRRALLNAHDVHLDDLAALDADVVRQDQVSRR